MGWAADKDTGVDGMEGSLDLRHPRSGSASVKDKACDAAQKVAAWNSAVQGAGQWRMAL
jgi:hypothetical protein